MSTLPPLYLPVEIKVREFKSKLLIALFACARGYSVCLAQKDAFNNVASRLCPGIVVGKSLNEVDARHFRQYRAYGHVVATMDEEILVYLSRQDLVRFLSREAIEMSGLIFAPGQDAIDILAAIDPDIAHRSRIVGLPRLDFLRPEFSLESQQRAEELRQAYGDFVLVNANFTLGNIHMPYERLLGILRDAGYIRTDKDEEFVLRRIEHDRRAMKAMIDLVAQLASRFPQISFIVRPHPQERPESYHAPLGNISNVIVSPPSEAVDTWLRGAVALLQNGCTTAVEAHELGTPILANAMVHDPVFDPYLPNALADIVTDPDGAAAWLDSILRDRPRRQQRDLLSDGHHYGHYVDRSSSKPSAERMVDALYAWAPELPATGEAHLDLDAYAQAPYVAEPFHKNEFIRAKFPDTKREDVEQMIDALRRALPALPPVRLANPARDVFVLRPT